MADETDSLAVGMPIVLDESTGGSEKKRRIVHVERLTATQITIDLRTTGFVPDKRRFNRASLKEIGRSQSWWTPRLHVATHELMVEVRDELRHAKAYAAVRNVPLKSLSADQLERIAAILAEGKSLAVPRSEAGQ